MMKYLYFAPNIENTAFKMGFSINPCLRLDTVVGNINYKKTYIFECEHAAAAEDFCHKFFKEFSVRIYEGDGATEWFDISIFKVALKKILKHTELLGIGQYFKYIDIYPIPEQRTSKHIDVPISTPPTMTGAEFKSIRKELGYTQEEFGKIIGYTRRMIINWETYDYPIERHVEQLMLSKKSKNVEFGSSVMSPEQFKSIRKSMGYTQKQLSDAIGYSRTQIGNFERGEYPVDKSMGLLITLMSNTPKDELCHIIEELSRCFSVR